MNATARWRDQVQGGLTGLLVGDALGVPYEFHPPEAIPALAEIDMLPPPDFHRTHIGTLPGTWSDDGAQALALLDSLLDCEGLNLTHFSSRLLAWLEEGAYAVDGRVFDVGVQTQHALNRLREGVDPRLAGPNGERDNGNGALMRVLPLALWHVGEDAELFDLAMRQCLPTHGHLRSQLCCALYCLWGRGELQGETGWDSAIRRVEQLVETRPDLHGEWALLRNEFGNAPKGSGYVVDSINSTRWSLQQGTDYASTVRAAISLGHDTDTTAAIAGGLAGVRYGLSGIPDGWRAWLKGRDILDPLMTRLIRRVENALR